MKKLKFLRRPFAQSVAKYGELRLETRELFITENVIYAARTLFPAFLRINPTKCTAASAGGRTAGTP